MRFNEDDDLLCNQEPLEEGQESLIEYLKARQQANKKTLLNLLAILGGNGISDYVRQFLRNHKPAPGTADVRGGDFDD